VSQDQHDELAAHRLELLTYPPPRPVDEDGPREFATMAPFEFFCLVIVAAAAVLLAIYGSIFVP
jgi:hypothetical protein